MSRLVQRKRGRKANSQKSVFCLEVIKEKENIRELKCRHLYHKACFDQWFVRGKNRCPLCMTAVLAETNPKQPQRAQTQGELAQGQQAQEQEAPRDQSQAEQPEPPRRDGEPGAANGRNAGPTLALIASPRVQRPAPTYLPFWA